MKYHPSTIPATATHTPAPLVSKEQYRPNSFGPHYWDVCTVRQDGTDTIYETVAENCSEQDAALTLRAVNSHAQLVDALEAVTNALALAFARAECDLRMWPVKDLESVEHQSLSTAAGKMFDALKQARSALSAAQQ